MELTLHKRGCKAKSENTKIRLEGGIPAVLYGHGMAKSEPVYILKKEFDSILRKVRQGRLSTVLFNLKQDAKNFKAIIKDVRYHPTTYEIEHIDLFKVDSQQVTVRVPVEFYGKEDCAGVRMGGVLRRVMRSVKVKCLPEDIPEKFAVDVKSLNIAQSKKVADLPASEKVKVLADPKQVIVTVAKMKG